MKEDFLLDHPTAEDCPKVVAIALGREALGDLLHVQHDVDARAVLAEHRLVRPALGCRRIFGRRGAQRLFELPAVAALGAGRRQAGLLQSGHAHLIIIALA